MIYYYQLNINLEAKMAIFSRPVSSQGDSVQQFYQEAGAIEARLINWNLSAGPFDPELEAQFNRAQDYFSRAIEVVRNRPEEKPLTMKHLKIQMLRTLVEQSDFQQALIASIAVEGAGSRTLPVEVIRTGAGRVSTNDQFNDKRVGVLGQRVTDESINLDFS